jgi:hypothetical protein
MNVRRVALLSFGLAARLGAQLCAQQPDSPWYQERGTQTRPLPEGDIKLDTALKLATLLRDGRVPGFYDGQFAAVNDRFEALAAIAGDPDMNHVLRVVAVMALQEAGEGEPVRRALEPLLMAPEQEFAIEYEARRRDGSEPDDEEFIRQVLAADLSQHVRFSLAKDGQPAHVLAKIKVMENHVHGNLAELLDPSVDSDDPRFRMRDVAEDRLTIFDIGYHYQQFDDFAHATEWFQLLCQNLPGHRDTEMAHYNLGCIEALSGRPESAMEHLRSAHAVGFTNVAWLLEDGDLTSLRARPDFAALVALMRNEAAPEGSPEGGPPAPAPAAGSVEPGGSLGPPGGTGR